MVLDGSVGTSSAAGMDERTLHLMSSSSMTAAVLRMYVVHELACLCTSNLVEAPHANHHEIKMILCMEAWLIMIFSDL